MLKRQMGQCKHPLEREKSFGVVKFIGSKLRTFSDRQPEIEEGLNEKSSKSGRGTLWDTEEGVVRNIMRIVFSMCICDDVR